MSAEGLASEVAPYGSWKSPISASMLAEGALRISDLCQDDGVLYWVELRPAEEGRCVIVRQEPNGQLQDVLPPPYSARTLVHEYGGGALLASRGGLYFSNFTDQRIWFVHEGHPPKPLTPQAKLRFADFIHDAPNDRLISICEDHSKAGEPSNRLVSVSLNTGRIETLAEGSDFYSSPRLSPDGGRLAWLEWNHPNMPWDGTRLCVAPVGKDGSLGERRLVAGGDDESIFQPEWSPGGKLYFVSDKNNWWNLHCEQDSQVVNILPMEAEFGVPQWVFGLATYGFAADGSVVARCNVGGRWRLLQINPSTGDYRDVPLPYCGILSLSVGDRRVYAEVASENEPGHLASIDLTSGQARVIRRCSPQSIDAGYSAAPQALEVPTEWGRKVHSYYYPPRNPDYQAPGDEKPPLIVMVHGGPTSGTGPSFRLSTQYWTSRGFAVCDVNYGGSTGYGREYRNGLRDAWGIVDVADAAATATHLAELGRVDPDRLIIRGGSAGGFTTLACLAFKDVFRCGTSLYGVSDLTLLTEDTHKFESRYLDRLVGPYPERADLYRERSPIHHIDGIDRPLLLLQGAEDAIVPPQQSTLIFESLRKSGVPAAYLSFAGEQHGFRQAKNIIRSYEAELYFYARVLGLTLPQSLEPVDVVNLTEP